MRIRSVGHLRRVFAAWALATTLAVVPALVVAAPPATYTYRISGIEYAGTPEQAKFAGVAVAVPPGDFGTWKAVVDHTLLSGTPLGATITGGTFAYDGRVRDIAGTFDEVGGSLTWTGASTSCGWETFAVYAPLTVTVTPGGAASGLFIGTLTHFNTKIFGPCITYFATVKGTVTFTLTP